MNERGDVAMQLGDPQSHVGGAGQDGRLRVLLAETRQLCKRCGREEAPAAVLQADRLGVAHGLELPALSGQRPLFPSRSRHIVHCLRGAHDRPVAGATAEVASENVVDAARIGLRLAEVGRVERHDEPRRAEAALRAMAVGKRLLHRMRGAIFALHVLHRHDAAPLEHRQQQDAGIDGAVVHGALAQLSDHDGAGAAIAFRAPFLGAGQPLGLAQIAEKGGGRRDGPQRLQLTVDDKRNMVAHRGRIQRRDLATAAQARRVLPGRRGFYDTPVRSAHLGTRPPPDGTELFSRHLSGTRCTR